MNTTTTDIREALNVCYEQIHHKTMTPDTPVTGVIGVSRPEWLGDDMYDAIDLDYETYIRDNPDDADGDGYCEYDPTLLIGFRETDDGRYEPDPEAEYSAIVNGLYVQIVRSKYVSRCAMCSLCFPGQGDLDTPGDQITFTLPPEVFGDSEHLPIEKLEDEPCTP